MPWGVSASAFGIACGLILALLRMRRDEYRNMGERIAALESDNRVCLVIQMRLIRIIRDNGLEVPEGTFDAIEVRHAADSLPRKPSTVSSRRRARGNTGRTVDQQRHLRDAGESQ